MSRTRYHLGVAGLDHPDCAGVLALTDDDEVNLSVTMAAALLRPDIQVIARTVSPAIAERMHAFGTPTVINPFDRFGDLLRLGAAGTGVVPADDVAGERARRRIADRAGGRRAMAVGCCAATAGSVATSPPICAPRVCRSR